jgi:hypothetical protein
MTFDTLFDDLTELEAKEGGVVKVVRARYPYILCWFREHYWAGNEIRFKTTGEAVCGIRRFNEFWAVDLKKDWGVMGELTYEQSKEIEERAVIEEKGSRGKSKSEVVSAGAGGVVSLPLDKPQEPQEPKRRGRAPNPLNAGIPKKLHCQVCNRDLATTPDQFRAQVQKSGLSQEEFVASYKCRGCRK